MHRAVDSALEHEEFNAAFLGCRGGVVVIHRGRDKRCCNMTFDNRSLDDLFGFFSCHLLHIGLKTIIYAVGSNMYGLVIPYIIWL